MFDWNSAKTKIEPAIAPDDTSPIDFILDDVLVKKIYGSWDESLWGQMLDYGGGVRAITASMLLGAGEEFLKNIRGIGPKRAVVILSSVRDTMREVAYL